MAIRYTTGGTGLASASTLSVINIVLVGDGVSTSVSIDLQKSPFLFDFKGFFPAAISVQKSGAPPESSVQLSANGVIKIDYASPLVDGSTGTYDTLTIQLLYE